MTGIVSARQMRAVEQAAFERGLTPGEAMERAGRALAGLVTGKRVLIVCGRGNNGGDGFVCARLLHERGVQVQVLQVGEGTYSAHAEENRQKILPLRVEEPHGPFDAAVDALFGIGFRGTATGKDAEAIALLNSQPFVVAADVPSGVPDNGLPTGCAVRADRTVTFGFLKSALVLGDGPEYAGDVTVADIGLGGGTDVRMPSAEDIRKAYPPRKSNSHKGTYGHIGVLAGSRGMEGAALLAATAALHTGAGRVTLGAPEDCRGFFENRPPELMCVYLPHKDGQLVPSEAAEQFLGGKDVLLCGPGLGRGKGPEGLVNLLLEKTVCPLVLDADALFSLRAEALKNRRVRQVYLTPHPAEFARLTGRSTEQVLEDPIGCCRQFAGDTAVTLLYKSAFHLTVSGSDCFLSHWGTDGMATAGSGDVLAGILATCSVRQHGAAAALTASFLHGTAGRAAETEKSPESMTASDIIRGLDKAFWQIKGKNL